MTCVINEAGLELFQAGFLSESYLLDEVAKSGMAIVAAAPGVGKSRTADKLVLSPATYDRYDLVVYAAPSWAVINERRVLRGVEAPVRHAVLTARPRERCGPLDARWAELEAAGCAAHAREELCATCPASQSCDWPDRLSPERLADVRLILMPEQHLVTNPLMVRLLKRQTKAKRALILLDEARFLDVPFTVALKVRELARFRDAVRSALGVDEAVRARWLQSLGALLSGADPRVTALSFPGALLRHGEAIQSAGLQLHGPAFRFIGYELAEYRRSRPDDRWRDDAGALRFELPPALEGDTLILSAYLEPEYVAHRLAVDHVAAPLAGYQVTHSDTRIFNIKSRLGMDGYYLDNLKQILDFFAALIASKIEKGRSTVVVTRKKFAEVCVEELTTRLAALGHDVRFVRDGFDALGAPDPLTIPVVTYGLVGINALINYETCICLNGFYVPPSALNEAVQGAVPESHRVELVVEVDDQGNRRVRVAEPLFRGGGFEDVANACLRKLELEPVLQAVARVRFSVRPREVWLFEMHDARPLVGEVTEVRTLAAAYAAAGLPRYPLLLRRRAAEALRALMAAEGLSMRAAAAHLGIDRQTASRWLREECHKSPLKDLLGGKS